MKKLLIPIIMLLTLIGLVSASTVNIDPQGILANSTYKPTTSIVYGFNITGNQSSYTCKLYGNDNLTNGVGIWRAIQTDSGVSNNTNTNFSTRVLKEISGLKYCWAVYCNGTTDGVGDWSAGGNSTQCVGSGMNFSVDATDPAITIYSPTDKSWDKDGNITFLFNAVDNNAASCIFGTSMNGSQDSNSTGAWNVSSVVSSYTNATNFTFTNYDNNIFTDNGTGAYYFQLVCNDSAGNTATVGNYTVYVDKTNPRAFAFDLSLFKTNHRSLWNNSIATDYTPQVGWNASYDVNFSRYEVYFYWNTYGNATYSSVNVTSAATLSVNSSLLSGDKTYLILVTAYDLAGNAVNMTTKGYKYSTDSTNRGLKSGWNIVGNVGNKFNLSDLLTWTGATTVSIWNSTHQFQTYVDGGSNGAVNVTAGNPVLIYLGSNTNMSDLIWNTTAVNVRGSISNITNQSASDWNLVMNKNSTTSYTFQQIDYYLNANSTKATGGKIAQLNVSFFDFYNNSAATGSKYIPYACNWTINNATTITYGDTFWIYLERAMSSMPINWSVI